MSAITARRSEGARPIETSELLTLKRRESATLLMQDSNNPNRLFINKKIDGVRESAHQNTPKIFEDAGICERIIGCAPDRDIQLKKKLNAEA